MMMSTIEELQKELCKKYEAEYLPLQSAFKVGITTNVREGGVPINGFRHPPEGDTMGWYIYAGEETSDDPDFLNLCILSTLTIGVPISRNI